MDPKAQGKVFYHFSEPEKEDPKARPPPNENKQHKDQEQPKDQEPPKPTRNDRTGSWFRRQKRSQNRK
jgi:hypothetical protein